MLEHARVEAGDLGDLPARDGDLDQLVARKVSAGLLGVHGERGLSVRSRLHHSAARSRAHTIA